MVRTHGTATSRLSARTSPRTTPATAVGTPSRPDGRGEVLRWIENLIEWLIDHARRRLSQRLARVADDPHDGQRTARIGLAAPGDSAADGIDVAEIRARHGFVDDRDTRGSCRVLRA